MPDSPNHRYDEECFTHMLPVIAWFDTASTTTPSQTATPTKPAGKIGLDRQSTRGPDFRPLTDHADMS